MHRYDSLEKTSHVSRLSISSFREGRRKYLNKKSNIETQRRELPNPGRVAWSQAGVVSRVLQNHIKKFGLYPSGSEESMKAFK